MIKTCMLTVALACAATALPMVGTASATTHHRRHAMMHHAMMSNNGGHQRHTFYGVGNAGQTPRTTMSGGNAGGYSSRN